MSVIISKQQAEKHAAGIARINKWHREHPERIREIKREWHRKNKEKINESIRLKRLADPEKYRKISNEHYHKNSEKLKEASRARWAKNPEKGREHGRKYRRNNGPEIYKRAAKKHSILRSQINAIKVKAGCVDCGYNEHPIALDFDHVKGIKGRTVSTCCTLVQALEEIAKCEVRCSNCHRIKTMMSKDYTKWREARKFHVQIAA